MQLHGNFSSWQPPNSHTKVWHCSTAFGHKIWLQYQSIPKSTIFLPQCRECFSMGAAVARIRRSLWHHLLHPLILRLLVICALVVLRPRALQDAQHPQAQIPNAFPDHYSFISTKSVSNSVFLMCAKFAANFLFFFKFDSNKWRKCFKKERQNLPFCFA